MRSRSHLSMAVLNTRPHPQPLSQVWERDANQERGQSILYVIQSRITDFRWDYT
ncbi:MAG: hypothetical protein PUP93_00740 [Rhizonema sp. NSF051]|nr:hypothetical protein [Rhizonema sp. NSF051]